MVQPPSHAGSANFTVPSFLLFPIRENALQFVSFPSLLFASLLFARGFFSFLPLQTSKFTLSSSFRRGLSLLRLRRRVLREGRQPVNWLVGHCFLLRTTAAGATTEGATTTKRAPQSQTTLMLARTGGVVANERTNANARYEIPPSGRAEGGSEGGEGLAPPPACSGFGFLAGSDFPRQFAQYQIRSGNARLKKPATRALAWFLGPH